MRAPANRGLRVGAAKVGPDFIDPSYHALATERPARNLDAWIWVATRGKLWGAPTTYPAAAHWRRSGS